MRGIVRPEGGGTRKTARDAPGWTNDAPARRKGTEEDPETQGPKVDTRLYQEHRSPWYFELRRVPGCDTAWQTSPT